MLGWGWDGVGGGDGMGGGVEGGGGAGVMGRRGERGYVERDQWVTWQVSVDNRLFMFTRYVSKQSPSAMGFLVI